MTLQGLKQSAELPSTGLPTGELSKVAGIVKWFDVSKKFGFIVPGSGGPDIFLDFDCLLRSGYRTVSAGSRIVATVGWRRQGFYAVYVESLDEPTFREPPTESARISVIPTGDFERMVLKSFFAGKGYGFFTRGENTPDVFIHIEVLRVAGLPNLELGASALVCCSKGPKGLRAVEVRPA